MVPAISCRLRLVTVVVERLPGAHCYEFFAGRTAFAEMADDEPATFWLTDFLARNFERLVIRGLGIDRHPELEAVYFGNYRRLVFLAQMDDDGLTRAATAESYSASCAVRPIRKVAQTGMTASTMPIALRRAKVAH